MNSRKYIVDIIKDLVANVETKLLPSLSLYDADIQAISYEFGHPLEIIETLHQKDGNSDFIYKKYPLVCLFTDIKEKKGLNGEYSEATLAIVVVQQTREEYKAAERKEFVFKPVIHPIVDALINEIALSPYFMQFDADLIKRVETDRYFWGRTSAGGTDANKFNDYLDATECAIDVTVSPFCILSPKTTNVK